MCCPNLLAESGMVRTAGEESARNIAVAEDRAQLIDTTKARITVSVESKILASREEAAQMLSISKRALDYLIATRHLPTRRICGRVLIPVSELRKYVRTDHPERIVA